MKKNKKHYDKYKKFDVVYADFGRNPHGVQGGIRPGIVVSCDASNHGGAPQISVVPLSSKLKDNPVHVIVEPSEIRGYALSNRSDFMPEDIQTLNKGCVRFKSGYIPGESEIREAMDRAMIMQLNLLPVARKMVLEELEMKQMDNRTKKTNNKRFVRYPEGAEMYSMSLSKFQQLAKDAKACYKMNRLVLVNLDILDEYLETFHIEDEEFYK